MKDLPVQPLHVRQLGQGPCQALALHCTIAHGGTWRGLSALMEHDITLTAPDMLCHGRSPDWDGQGDFMARSSDSAAELLSEPMDLIGHSFGAALALRLALLYPEKVRSLTMIEPVMFSVAAQDAPEMAAAQRAQSEPFTTALAKGDNELGARLFNRAWGLKNGPSWEQMPEQMRAAMTRGVVVVPASNAALIEDIHGVLTPGVLEGISCPVLLLRGSDTDPVMSVVCEGLARRIPGATSHIIEGAGHMLPISHPKQTAEIWANFLKSS